MNLEGFGVVVTPGRESEGYVYLRDGQQYFIGLTNAAWNKRATASVEIDGQHVGTFIIPAGNQRVGIERSVHSNGIFTFVVRDTKAGHDGGLDQVNPDNLGLIKVVFKQEVLPLPSPRRFSRDRFTAGLASDMLYSNGGVLGISEAGVPKSMGGGGTLSSGGRAGGTVETGLSGQRFYAGDSFPLDEFNPVTIYLRLREEYDTPRGVRPLNYGKSTNYPRPI